MKRKINNLKEWGLNNKFYILLALIIGIFIIRYEPVGDDITYNSKITEMGTIKFIITEYTTWAGRLPQIIIMTLINYNLIIWKLCNIIMTFLFLKGFSLYYKFYFKTKNKLEVDRLLFFCFFFIFPYTITSSMIWVTGSYMYLWVVTPFIYAIYPFYKLIFISHNLEFSKFEWFLFYIAMFFTSYVEQEFLILFVLSTISMLYLQKKKEIYSDSLKKMYFYYLFFLFNLLVARSSPGLGKRILGELRWYPNWENMPFIYRFYEVINLSNKHLIFGSNILFLIFISLLSLLIYKKWGSKMKVLFLPLLYFLLRILPLDIFSKNTMLWYFNFENFFNVDPNSKQTLFLEDITNKFLYDMGKVTETLKISRINYVSSVIAFTIIIFISLILYSVFEDKKRGMLYFLIYWAGFFSIYIMVFIPAVYAIGSRAFFLMDCFILFLISQLYTELKIKYRIDKEIYFKIILYFLFIYSVLIILSYSNYLKQSITA